MTLQAILFDHDGTLVDSECVHYQLWADVLTPYRVALTEQQYKDYYAGVPTGANATDIAERFELNVVPAALAQQKHDATHAFLAQHAFPLMPGAYDTVSLFDRCGLQLAVVTGADRRGVTASLATHRLQPFFKTVVSGDDVRYSKPAPDCYLLALERLQLPAAACIAIEDTEHGVAAATAAGVPCIAIPNRMSAGHDFSKATVICASMHDASRWIADTYSLPMPTR